MGQLIMKVLLKSLKLMTQEFKNRFLKLFRVKLFIRIFSCTVYHCISAGEDASGSSALIYWANALDLFCKIKQDGASLIF